MKAKRQHAKISNRAVRRMVQVLDQENRMLRACLGAACKQRVEELTADISEPLPNDAGLPAFSFRPEELGPEARGEAYVDEHDEHVVVRWTPPPTWREHQEEQET